MKNLFIRFGRIRTISKIGKYLIFLILSVGLSGPGSIQGQNPPGSDCPKRYLSYELPDGARKAWKPIESDWMKNHYWACLEKFKLKMSCADCVNIYVDVELHINKDGRLENYKILKENICAKKISPELEKCFLEEFQHMIFPEALRNLIIEARLGTGLTC